MRVKMKNGLSYQNLRTWNKKFPAKLAASLNLNKSRSQLVMLVKIKNRRTLRAMAFPVTMNSMWSLRRSAISSWPASLGLEQSRSLKTLLFATLHHPISHTKLISFTVTKVTLRAKTSTTTQIINVCIWRPRLELFWTQKSVLSRYSVEVRSSSSGASSKRRANSAIVMTSSL